MALDLDDIRKQMDDLSVKRDSLKMVKIKAIIKCLAALTRSFRILFYILLRKKYCHRDLCRTTSKVQNADASSAYNATKNRKRDNGHLYMALIRLRRLKIFESHIYWENIANFTAHLT